MPDTPAPLEATRISIARDLIVGRKLILRVALWLMPKRHPWRIFNESLLNDVNQLHGYTMMSRGRRVTRWTRGASAALWLTLALFLAYCIGAATHPAVLDLPELIGY